MNANEGAGSEKKVLLTKPHFKQELTTLEKVMKFNTRFKQDFIRHPSELMAILNEDINTKIVTVTKMVRRKLATNIRASTVAMITVLVSLRDTLV